MTIRAEQSHTGKDFKGGGLTGTFIGDADVRGPTPAAVN